MVVTPPRTREKGCRRELRGSRGQRGDSIDEVEDGHDLADQAKDMATVGPFLDGLLQDRNALLKVFRFGVLRELVLLFRFQLFQLASPRSYRRKGASRYGHDDQHKLFARELVLLW